MPYVMVPVPEDLVEDVMQFVLRAMSKAAQEAWDEGSMRTLWDDIDEMSRALLSFVARAARSGQDLSEVEAARLVQLSGREMLAIQREVNDAARESKRPPPILQRTVEVVQPSGRAAEERVLTMDRDVADLVQRAERAELLAERQLIGTPGEPPV